MGANNNYRLQRRFYLSVILTYYTGILFETRHLPYSVSFYSHLRFFHFFTGLLSFVYVCMCVCYINNCDGKVS